MLVVDDDPVSRVIIRAALKGFESEWISIGAHFSQSPRSVHLAENVGSALDVLHRERVDIVLCDVVLQEDTGWRLLELINSSNEFKNIPVISEFSPSHPVSFFAFTPSSVPVISASLSAGDHIGSCADFMTKPLTAELLKRKVSSSIRLSQQKAREHQYEVELGELRGKVEDMSARTEELIETPLNAVLRRLRNLVLDDGEAKVLDDPTSSGIRKELRQVLRDLASSNLYGPAVERISHRDIDPITRSFLLETFVQPHSLIPASPRPAAIDSISEATTQQLSPADLAAWEFDLFRFSEASLVDKVVEIFRASGVTRAFPIPLDRLRSFAASVRRMSHPQAEYHGWFHHFDVVQAVFSLLCMHQDLVAEQLSSHDVLSILLASLFHDVDHPGTGNHFQVSAGTELAMTYNDISVLENHHASVGLKLLNSEGVVALLPPEQRRALRAKMIDLILATDLSRHGAIVTEWNATQAAGEGVGPEGRKALLKMIIKAADVSNASRPWEVAHRWSHMVSDEFFHQAREERSLGIPVTPHMDESRTSVPRIAIAFIDNVASSTVSLLSQRLPGAKRLLDFFAINRQHFVDIDSGKEQCPWAPRTPVSTRPSCGEKK